MLAVVVASKDPLEIISESIALVERFPGQCGIEFGLCESFDLPENIVERVAALPVSAKALHADRNAIGLEGLSSGNVEAVARVQAEARICKALAIDRAVVHSRVQVDRRPHDESNPRASARVWAVGALCMANAGLTPLYEKTVESLNWFEEFFDEWDRLGLAPQTGFTLDIGHARVWQRTSLEHWLQFTQQLQARGFELHFHVHGNNGEADQHRALHLAWEEGLLAPSADYAPRGVLPWLGEAMAAHPNALFTLENVAHLGPQAFRYTRNALAHATDKEAASNSLEPLCVE